MDLLLSRFADFLFGLKSHARLRLANSQIAIFLLRSAYQLVESDHTAEFIADPNVIVLLARVQESACSELSASNGSDAHNEATFVDCADFKSCQLPLLCVTLLTAHIDWRVIANGKGRFPVSNFLVDLEFVRSPQKQAVPTSTQTSVGVAEGAPVRQRRAGLQ